MRIHKLLNISINPIILLFVIFSLIGLSFVWTLEKNKWAEEIKQAKVAYAQTLFTTKSQLSNLVYEATESSVLSQNLDWGLEHSLRSSLNGFLNPGQLSQLAIFDTNCKLIVSTNSSVPSACPDTLKSFLYTSKDNLTEISLALPISTKPNYLILGKIQLNEVWLDLYPELKTQLKQLDLTLVSKPDKHSTILDYDGFTKSKEIAIGLVSNNLFINKISTLQFGNKTKLPTEIWFLVFLSGITLLLIWRKTEPKPAQQSDDVQRPLDEPTGEISQHIAKLKSEIAENRKTNTELRGQKLALETELTATKEYLQQTAQSDSLAMQMEQSNLGNHLEQLKSTHEDLTDIVRHGIAQKTRVLASIMESWRFQCESRGERRFLRSLSEQQSASGASMLTEQMQLLLTTSEQILDLTLNASSVCQRVESGIEVAERQINHWLALATESESSLSESLLHSVLNAQKQFDGKCSFENDIDDLLEGITLPMSSEKSEALIYHAYHCFTDAFTHSHIKTRYRKKNAQANLVISPMEFNGISINTIKSSQHWEMLQRLSAKTSVHCAIITGTNNFLGICFSWEGLPFQDIVASSRNHVVVPSL